MGAKAAAAGWARPLAWREHNADFPIGINPPTSGTLLECQREVQHSRRWEPWRRAEWCLLLLLLRSWLLLLNMVRNYLTQLMLPLVLLR